MAVITANLTIFVSFTVDKTTTLHTALDMKVRMFQVFQNTKLDERKRCDLKAPFWSPCNFLEHDECADK
jgi:hypothetical protein